MLHLNSIQLNRLYPFYFEIDKDKKLLSIGDSMKKVVPGESDFLKIVVVEIAGSTVQLEVLDLQETDSFNFTVTVNGKILSFSGCLWEDPQKETFIFLGGPKNFNVEDLEWFQHHDLTFGMHDLTLDLVDEMRRNDNVQKEMTEITKELILSHEQLVDTSARLTSLLDSLDSAILSETKDRKVVVMNKMFCKLFNLPGSPEDYLGTDCSRAAEFSKSLFKDPDSFIAGIESLIDSKEKVTGELLHMKDGSVLKRDFIPVYEMGVYEGHTWKYKDITELVHNRETLVKTEDKYSRIIENLKFGLVEVDLNEVITKVYPAFCELTGYSESELIGQNARDLLALKEDLEESQVLNDKRKEGVSNVYERRIRRKDGKIIYIIISGAPIFNDNDEVIGSMGIHVDITDRKMMEQDLIDAKEAALSSVNAKEMFLANMSHEIRTPMNVIIGMTELLCDTSLDTEQRKYINAVIASAQNLLALINDILDFSKIEAGHLQLDETPGDLSEFFNQLDLTFKEIASKKGVLFTVELDHMISNSLLYDPTKLNQVLTNLISNAIKFTDNGSVKVAASIIKDDSDFQEIVFKVKDSGIGIDKINHEQIFRTFSQEDAGISRRFGGTGLGLSISRSIVRKMGSDISLHSEKGAGSEFYFSLKLRKTKSTSVKSTNQAYQINLGEIRILVAEDNELNRLLISSVLTKAGLNFRIAENGKQAIEFLNKDTYDLVLMDIQMPEMDGITATREIRQTYKSSIPIVALSANASPDDTRNYLAVGMNAHVPKPFKQEQLFEVISNVLNLKDTVAEKNSSVAESESLFSTEELLQIGMGDEQFVLSVLKTFNDTIPVQLERLTESIIKQDATAIKSIAHQLKPSIDLLHIYSVKDLVRSIEKESMEPQPNMKKLELYVTEFVRELTQVINEISRQLDQ